DVRIAAHDLALIMDEAVYEVHQRRILRHPHGNIHAGQLPPRRPGIEVKEANLVIGVVSAELLVLLGDIDENLAALSGLLQDMAEKLYVSQGRTARRAQQAV